MAASPLLLPQTVSYGSLDLVHSVTVIDQLSISLAGKKLERGISRANDNAGIVNRARNEMAMDIRGNFLVDVESLNTGGANYTFTIPDLTVYSEDFR